MAQNRYNTALTKHFKCIEAFCSRTRHFCRAVKRKVLSSTLSGRTAFERQVESEVGFLKQCFPIKWGQIICVFWSGHSCPQDTLCRLWPALRERFLGVSMQPQLHLCTVCGEGGLTLNFRKGRCHACQVIGGSRCEDMWA
jgi:hypothetical protein